MSQPREVQIQALAVSRTIAAAFFRRAKSPIMVGKLCCISLRKLFWEIHTMQICRSLQGTLYYDTTVKHATSSTARSTSDCFATIRFSPYYYYVIAIYSKCVSDWYFAPTWPNKLMHTTPLWLFCHTDHTCNSAHPFSCWCGQSNTTSSHNHNKPHTFISFTQALQSMKSHWCSLPHLI